MCWREKAISGVESDSVCNPRRAGRSKGLVPVMGGIMRVNRFSGRLGVSLLMLAGFAGCGTLTDSPTSPFSASGTSSTVSALASPDVSTFNVESAATGTDGRGPCRFHLGTGRFDCDNQRSGNLTFSRTVTFFDAAGAVQN